MAGVGESGRSAASAPTRAERQRWLTLDRFVPEAALRCGGEPLRRARLALQVGLVTLTGFLAVALLQSTLGGADLATTAALCALATAALPLLMRRFQSTALYSHGLLLVIWCFAALSIAASQGQVPGAYYSIVVLSLVAVLLGSTRAVIAWTLVALLSIPLIVPLVTPIATWLIPLQVTRPSIGMKLSTMLMTLLMLGVGLAWESLRRGVNTQLQASELRFLALAESAHVVISEIDASGHLAYLSPNELRSVAADGASVAGRHYLDFVHPEDRALARQLVDAAWRGEEIGSHDLRLRDGETNWRWFESSTRLYTNAQGERHVLALGREITERKRAESELERHREHLEELVEERTRRLVESQHRLRDSEHLASIGTLAAGIAHQVNNPIGAILAGCQYALGGDEEGAENAAEWRRTARHVLSENAQLAKRCGRIVRSILQFARNERTDKWQEDVNTIVRRAARACTARAESRGARIELALESEELRTLLSPIEIEQVIVNLIENAILSHRTGATITLRSSVDTEWIRIKVEDDGEGIEARNLPRIFDPFFTTRLGEGGTGLGLSVAHGIVEGHGGQIQIESEVGRGTRVHVLLPRV